MNTIRVIPDARIHPGKAEAFTEIASACLTATRRDPGTRVMSGT